MSVLVKFSSKDIVIGPSAKYLNEVMDDLSRYLDGFGFSKLNSLVDEDLLSGEVTNWQNNDH